MLHKLRQRAAIHRPERVIAPSLYPVFRNTWPAGNTGNSSSNRAPAEMYEMSPTEKEEKI